MFTVEADDKNHGTHFVAMVQTPMQDVNENDVLSTESITFENAEGTTRTTTERIVKNPSHTSKTTFIKQTRSRHSCEGIGYFVNDTVASMPYDFDSTPKSSRHHSHITDRRNLGDNFRYDVPDIEHPVIYSERSVSTKQGTCDVGLLPDLVEGTSGPRKECAQPSPPTSPEWMLDVEKLVIEKDTLDLDSEICEESITPNKTASVPEAIQESKSGDDKGSCDPERIPSIVPERHHLVSLYAGEYDYGLF